MYPGVRCFYIIIITINIEAKPNRYCHHCSRPMEDVMSHTMIKHLIFITQHL